MATSRLRDNTDSAFPSQRRVRSLERPDLVHRMVKTVDEDGSIELAQGRTKWLVPVMYQEFETRDLVARLCQSDRFRGEVNTQDLVPAPSEKGAGPTHAAPEVEDASGRFREKADDGADLDQKSRSIALRERLSCGLLKRLFGNTAEIRGLNFFGLGGRRPSRFCHLVVMIITITARLTN
jgi:hypothetical protein